MTKIYVLIVYKKLGVRHSNDTHRHFHPGQIFANDNLFHSNGTKVTN
jgi:hypothetical protein